MTSSSHHDNGFLNRLIFYSAQPLSFFWLLILLMMVGGVVPFIWIGRIPGEAIMGCATLVGVVRLLANVKGHRPWPWSR